MKDPVLARIGDEGTLEILSGQRRHMIATELNYPVPTIIQKISDADAKILVADGNLHRPHISAYDLSRSLRMKMEGIRRPAAVTGGLHHPHYRPGGPGKGFDFVAIRLYQ